MKNIENLTKSVNENKLNFNVLNVDYDYDYDVYKKSKGVIAISVALFDLYSTFNIDDEAPSILSNNVFRSNTVFEFLKTNAPLCEDDWNLMFDTDCKKMLSNANVDNVLDGKFEINVFKTLNVLTNRYQIIFEIEFDITC